MTEQSPSAENKISAVEILVNKYPFIAGLQAYEYLRCDITAKKEAFLGDSAFELNIIYESLNMPSITSLKEPMLQGLQTMLAGEKSLKSESLYECLEYRYSELFLLDMARIMNGPEYEDVQRDEAKVWFKKASEGLYGKPNTAVFTGLSNEKIWMALRENGSDPIKNQLRDDLYGLLGSTAASTYYRYPPQPETVSRISRLTLQKFNSIIDHIEEDHTYTVEEMRQALQISLDRLGASYLGWRAEVVPNSSALSTIAEKKLVEVGASRKEITGNILKRKVIHEIGVHALRSINALKSGWLSAAYGQKDYLPFEEGLATAMEDALGGQFKDHGIDYYLIAGLAYGLDDHSPRNMREVFEIMWRVKALDTKKSLENDSIKKLQSEAFDQCFRMFRGTDTKTKGLVYLKDLAYFNGQELAWSILSQIYTEEDFNLLFAGKLDLTKPQQASIAREINDVNSSNHH